jgi:hypothetical protein
VRVQCISLEGHPQCFLFVRRHIKVGKTSRTNRQCKG